MPYEEVIEPSRGSDAFRSGGSTAILSQAAILLVLGAQLRGDDYSLDGRAAAAGLQTAMKAIPENDLASFPVPRIATVGERIGFERVRLSLTEHYGRGMIPLISRAVDEPLVTFPFDVGADIARRLYNNPNPLIAAQLLEIYLRHPDELLRVAAAISYFDLSAEPSRLLPILVNGTSSHEELVRDIAATALGRIYPTHPRLLELTQSTAPRTGDPASHSSLLVHGTFARGLSWWKPGGDFHSYIRTHVRTDLYDASDWLGWSGGYSDTARAIGADDLYDWIIKKGWHHPSLFTHSHGGSIAMLASTRAQIHAEF